MIFKGEFKIKYPPIDIHSIINFTVLMDVVKLFLSEFTYFFTEVSKLFRIFEEKKSNSLSTDFINFNE